MARPKSPTGTKKGATTITPPVPAPESAVDPLQTETRPDTRILAVKKTDSRPNLVPINLEDEIRRRAYELAQQRGFESGHETEDWVTAEREVLQRYHQQSA